MLKIIKNICLNSNNYYKSQYFIIKFIIFYKRKGKFWEDMTTDNFLIFGSSRQRIIKFTHMIIDDFELIPFLNIFFLKKKNSKN